MSTPGNVDRCPVDDSLNTSYSWRHFLPERTQTPLTTPEFSTTLFSNNSRSLSYIVPTILPALVRKPFSNKNRYDGGSERYDWFGSEKPDGIPVSDSKPIYSERLSNLIVVRFTVLENRRGYASSSGASARVSRRQLQLERNSYAGRNSPWFHGVAVSSP